MSRNLTSADVVAITRLISTERLATFRKLTASDDDAIELHQATMMLGASIMTVSGTIEIALRNSVCEHLAQDVGVDWLRSRPRPIRLDGHEEGQITKAEKQAQRAVYSKLENPEKRALDAKAFPKGKPGHLSHADVAIARQRTLAVSDGQVVAQLTIYFWKSLFSGRYEKTLWKRSLKSVFPNKTYSRALVADHLETLYQMRNRLAHHEPVYGSRLDEITTAIDFIAENLGSRTPSQESPAAKFILPHRERLRADVAVFQTTFDRLAT